MNTLQPRWQKQRGRPNSPPGWLDRQQLAAHIGVGTQRIAAWEKAGKLPKGKMWGTLKVWNVAEIENFLGTLEVKQEGEA